MTGDDMSRKFDPDSETNNSRRKFLKTLGAATAGVLFAPYIKSAGVLAYGYEKNAAYLAQVAITNTKDTLADSYDPAAVKQKVQYLLEQIGGINDIMKAGKKVAIKINLTGGSYWADPAHNPKLNGVPITEAMWTHPVVIQAVGQLIIDAGVSPGDISIVESLGGTDSFKNSAFADYMAVKNALGCNLIDLSKGTFVPMSTGSGYFNFASLTMNQILKDADVYVSIPKLKQHAEAGLTCSLKNQVGTVPQSDYTITNDSGRRGAMHHKVSTDASNHYLPESVCDLNAARPVTLAVVDGIKNATGGEGGWNTNFQPSESHVLFAGKQPVAVDSIGAYLMGLDSEAATLPLPDGKTTCDNYLDLLHTKGVGTNRLREIEILGDGASLITSVKPRNEIKQPVNFQLSQNFPNPFNPSTTIIFYLPATERVAMKVFDVTGREVETLVDGVVPAGEHRLDWNATGLASGVYFCRMSAVSAGGAGQFTRTVKMMYEK